FDFFICHPRSAAHMLNENFPKSNGPVCRKQVTRLPDQKNDHLVYIDFVEAAPWNRREILGELPKFSGAGSILIRAAIEYSKVEGFKGRIGLHSLPQANDFYANRVRMTDLGQDSNYQNLRYFEMTPEQAEAFIREGK
ncbi:hypothetical protein ACQKI2_17570, partial [Hyphomonas sp. NPDC076881]